MNRTTVLLASTNPEKQGKLAWILEGLSAIPALPGELGLSDVAPSEDGGTSHQNVACLKAEAWSRCTPILVMSSDGGLVIPSLGPEWESLYTRRFAGEGADDRIRAQRLLELLSNRVGEERKASWVEGLAIAQGGRTLASWEVTGPTGVILQKPPTMPAAEGFWVFPLWYFPHLDKTYSQLDEQELASINDHWGQLKDRVRGFFQA